MNSSPLGRVSAQLSCLKKGRDTNAKKGFTHPNHKVLIILGRGSGELLHPLQPGEQSHHRLSFHRASSVIPSAEGFGWGLIFLISLIPDSKVGDQIGSSGRIPRSKLQCEHQWQQTWDFIWELFTGREKFLGWNGDEQISIYNCIISGQVLQSLFWKISRSYKKNFGINLLISAWSLRTITFGFF